MPRHRAVERENEKLEGATQDKGELGPDVERRRAERGTRQEGGEEREGEASGLPTLGSRAERKAPTQSDLSQPDFDG